MQCGRCKGFGHKLETCRAPEKKEWRAMPLPEPVVEVPEPVIQIVAETEASNNNSVVVNTSKEEGAPTILVEEQDTIITSETMRQMEIQSNGRNVVVTGGSTQNANATQPSGSQNMKKDTDVMQSAGGGNIPLSPNAFSSLEY